MEHTISMIAAIGENRALGKDNKLLWHIPDDLKRFRSVTKGHSCIMGRKTFDSIVAILGKPLPDRLNIVLTHDTKWTYAGVPSASNMEEAIRLAKQRPGNDEIFIIGGGQIYKLGLQYADKLYLTIVHESKEGDSFFPEYESTFKEKTFEENHDWRGLKYTWIDLARS